MKANKNQANARKALEKQRKKRIFALLLSRTSDAKTSNNLDEKQEKQEENNY
jgi:hypothetical protein